MTYVHVERRGPVGWAVLDRPERGNALGPEIGDELATWIDRWGNDPEVSCLALGAVGKAFCAGADVKASQAMVGRPEERRSYFEQIDQLLQSFSEVPVPVIAAVNGVAHAGGLELVLACDLVVTGPEARLGDLHMPHGRIPAWGSAARLAGALGPWRAAAALLLPQTFTGAEMLASGIVAKVSGEGELDSDVQAMGEYFASLDPDALRSMKRLIAAQREAMIRPMFALGKTHFNQFLDEPGMQSPPPGFESSSARK